MDDTAQPFAAAAPDPMANAAEAFKVALGQTEPRKREDNGRFAAAEAEPEIEAPEEAVEADAGAESPEVEQEADEAAEEAQPEDAPLPTSWPAEHAETWQTLPAEAKAVIAEREAQRDAAVNAKFQEAANVRRGHEATIAEAQANREKYAAGLDQVMSLMQPQWPSPTMLDVNSGDYDPDAYHLQRANAEQQQGHLQYLTAQREQITAQAQQEAQQAERAEFEAVESRFRPKLIELVPDIASPEKQGAALTEIARYAIENGVPEQVFTDPTMAARITSAELSMAWKAMQFDKQQAAKGRVTPKAAKAPTPSVKAGAQPTRSSVQNQQYQRDSQRLAKSGSVEDGAAVWKRFL